MLIDVKNLSVAYYGEDGEVPAVSGVSLDLSAGKILCVVGESGSGKSSLALALLGLLPPTAAKVSVDSLVLRGTELRNAPEREWLKVRGRKVGYVFQDPLAGLNPVYRAGAQVAEAAELYYPELKGNARRSRVLERFAETGIADPERVYDSFPHELSGGIRQRVLLAMALLGKPELLIADEPTSCVDVTLQAQILDLILARREAWGMGALLITHDLGVVAAVADEVAVMKEGKIVERGTVEEVFYAAKHASTKALLELRL